MVKGGALVGRRGVSKNMGRLRVRRTLSATTSGGVLIGRLTVSALDLATVHAKKPAQLQKATTPMHMQTSQLQVQNSMAANFDTPTHILGSLTKRKIKSMK